MQLGIEKQIEILQFLTNNFSEFVEKKELNYKKALLVHEYTNFLRNKIIGKTV